MTGHAAGPGPAGATLLVGVSATGYRCEGGFNGARQPANQWSAWERVGAVEPTGPGCDLWAHPEPAIERATGAGARVLAVGVEWARVEPAPGHVDEAALAHYGAIVEMARAHGLLPVVTLQDVAHPQWLGDEFWLTPGAPDRFAEHAGRVVAALAAHCAHWVTVRQPNRLAACGWVSGVYPPGRLGAVADAWAVLDNLCSAHVLAYDEIHRLQPDATVALGIRRAGSYDEGRLAVDLVCAPQLGIDRSAVDAWVDERRVAHDATFAPDDLADLVRRRMVGLQSPFGRRARGFRRPSPRRILAVGYGRPGGRPALDALWLVWRPLRTSRTVPGPYGAKDAAALETWCASQTLSTPGVPLWVEDGVAVPPDPPAGRDRASYLRASLGAVAAARAAGVPVAAYVYHSLGPDRELALTSSRGISRVVSSVLPAAAGPAARGRARSPSARVEDFGLFDVSASPVGDPRWQGHDAAGESPSRVLRGFADAQAQGAASASNGSAAGDDSLTAINAAGGSAPGGTAMQDTAVEKAVTHDSETDAASSGRYRG